MVLRQALSAFVGGWLLRAKRLCIADALAELSVFIDVCVFVSVCVCMLCAYARHYIRMCVCIMNVCRTPIKLMSYL